MKLAALATLFVPGMAFAAWTTTDFPAFTEEGTGRFESAGPFFGKSRKVGGSPGGKGHPRHE